MRPRFELLDPALIERVVGEALAAPRPSPASRSRSRRRSRVLVAGGATADGDRVRIPEAMVRRALDTAPRSFDLLRAGHGRRRRPLRAGRRPLRPGLVGRGRPRPRHAGHAASRRRRTSSGSSGSPTRSPAYDAVSTAVVAHDVPTEIGDLYRLFLVHAPLVQAGGHRGVHAARAGDHARPACDSTPAGAAAPGREAAGRLRRLPVAAADLVRVRAAAT